MALPDGNQSSMGERRARSGYNLLALLLLLCLWIQSALAQVSANDPPRAVDSLQVSPPTPLGRRIDNFALGDSRGAQHALEDYAHAPAVVVVFLGTECPLAVTYAPRLAALAAEFGPRGAIFLGVNSNRQDSLAEIEQFSRQHELPFPVLKDSSTAVAKQFGAVRTPQAFVLDNERVVRYVGRIDDQYGLSDGGSFQRPRVLRRDLASALEEVLSGQSVTVPETTATGCLIARPRAPQADSPVTWSRQISRIFQSHCQSCHRAGNIAPFPLLTYQDALGWEDMILEVVAERRMPPWHANPQFGSFANDCRLRDDEIDLVRQWVEHGAPEGDVAEAPAPRQFTDGWDIPQPDLVVPMSDQPFVIPQQDNLEYQFFVVDPGLREDCWVQAAECRAGNRSVVHHITVFAVPPEVQVDIHDPNLFRYAFVGTSPGGKPCLFPPGVARLLSAGTRFIFEIHYTPRGRAETDLSSVGLKFVDAGQVRRPVQTVIAMNTALDIPPMDPDYVAATDYTLTDDVELLLLNPHMHLRGRSFRFTAMFPHGRAEVLLDVPHYDFNWQHNYFLAEPKKLPQGTVIRCEGHFDNSPQNLSNPDPASRVRWGDQTWQEMLVACFVVIPDHDDPQWVYAGPTGPSMPPAEPPRAEVATSLGIAVLSLVFAAVLLRWVIIRRRKVPTIVTQT